nr:hypothetical protein [Halocatena marina]
MNCTVKSYCLECDWTVRDDIVTDRNAMMIDHADETGHDIDSVFVSSS